MRETRSSRKQEKDRESAATKGSGERLAMPSRARQGFRAPAELALRFPPKRKACAKHRLFFLVKCVGERNAFKPQVRKKHRICSDQRERREAWPSRKQTRCV